MKILIAHNEYGAPSGEEHALGVIADLLKDNGHQVKWFLRSSAEIHGFADKISAFFSGIHNPRTCKRLCSFLRKEPVDAALVQNLYPFLSPSILPIFKRSGIPVVMRCPNYRLFCPSGLHLSHGDICERCLNGKEYWCVIRNCENSLSKSMGYALRNAAARITRRIVDNVDLFVVLSEFQRMRFIEGGIPEDRLALLPNTAPEVESEIPSGPGDFVSFVGRVSPEKGINDFVSCARRLPDVTFAVAGHYDQMPDLVNSSPANVQWRGFLKGAELDAFYQRSRMLIVPGRWFEGFPNVIIRAMAFGKPVVASRLGAIPEIVEHERTGLLFEPGNVDALTESVQCLYSNPSLCDRLGRAGQLKSETAYSRRTISETLATIFDCVSRSNRKPR